MKIDWQYFLCIGIVVVIVSVFFAISLAKLEMLDREVKELRARQRLVVSKVEDVSLSCQTLEKELEAMSLKGLIFKKRQK